MKKILTIIAFIFLITAGTAGAEDYQYQYFAGEKDKYVPFSDWIPQYRKHVYTVPHFLEDYYLLYGMKLYYDENSLQRNIEVLKTALQCHFRHPSNALVKVQSEEEYTKYRNLMFMHINMLLCRNYRMIGVRFDKQHIYFYDDSYAEDLLKSLDMAKDIYNEAIPYWLEAKKYAERASQIKITTDLGNIESERFSIMNGDTDMEKFIKRDIDNIEKEIKAERHERRSETIINQIGTNPASGLC